MRLLYLLIPVLIFTSCQKENDTDPPSTDPPNGALKNLKYRYGIGVDSLIYYYTGERIDSFVSAYSGDAFHLHYNTEGKVDYRIDVIKDQSSPFAEKMDSFYYNGSRVWKLVNFYRLRNTGSIRKTNEYEIVYDNAGQVSKFYHTSFAPDGSGITRLPIRSIQYTNGNLTELIVDATFGNNEAYWVTYSDKKLPPYLKQNMMQLAPFFFFEWLSSNSEFVEYLFFITSEYVPAEIAGASNMKFNFVDDPACPSKLNMRAWNNAQTFLKPEIVGCE